MQKTLQTAFQKFKVGDHEAAKTLCLDILARSPEHSETRYLLGLVYLQQGDPANAAVHLKFAVENNPHNTQFLYNYGFILLQQKNFLEAQTILSRVAELQPSLPEAHFLLGNALFEQGLPAKAVVHYQRALDINPGYHDAWFNLGIALKDLQCYTEAVTAFEKALAIVPDHTPSLFNLGVVLHAQGLDSSAIEAYRKITKTTQNAPDTCTNLGILLRNAGQLDEAIYWLKRANTLQPDNPAILNDLGLAVHEAKQFDDALSSFRQAIELKPDFAEAYSNIGNTLLATRQFSEAMAHYRQAIAKNPKLHEAWYNLGNCHTELANPDQAIPMYRQAIAIKPDLAEAHWNLSHALLLNGQYQEGFKEYLWRWQRKAAVKLDIPKPEWQGEPIPDRTLLVHAEQGLGDAIQFVHYLPLVKDRVGKLFLACDASQTSLFQSLAGVDAILDNASLIKIFPVMDFHVPLLNLPTIFTTSEDTIPHSVPYLKASRKSIQEYAPLFADAAGTLKVGMAWQGNPRHVNDTNRSCRLADFEPLFSLPGIGFFSLQKNRGSDEPSFPGVDLANHMQTFADTAALISHLDLVVSVDTAVTHLAGALGKTVWTLLPFVPEWRWRISGEQTPWYPTMRLFRQPRPGDWSTVIEQVKAELTAMVNGLALRNTK